MSEQNTVQNENDIDQDDIKNDNQDQPMVDFNYTPSQQHIVNMITAHLKGDEDTAAKEVQQAFNIKTADILSNWYNVSTDLKSVLDKMAKG